MSGSLENIRIHGSVVGGLEKYLASLGYDLQALALEYGLTLGPPEEWSTRYISLVEYSQFLERVSSLLNDPYLSLNWTSVDPAGGMKQMALAARFAPSPLEALKIMSRFASIAIDLSVCDVVIEKDTVYYCWDYSPLVVKPEQLTDRFASIVAQRFLTGFAGASSSPLEASMRREQPKNSSLYRQMLGGPVKFGSDINKIIFSREQLTQSNPGYDGEMFEALIELCERRLADTRKQGDLAALVQDVVVHRIASADLSLELVARDLGMSGRVLQRRLAENGTTFQEIHDRMRRDLASELLRNTGAPISEIAYRVGFSATGNFTRAAKRWFGLPPKQWRQQEAVVPEFLRSTMKKS
ncbi:helix-turn-helix transcriptional regulator [Roseibium polysiphoniae]|uniref:Helix-turn-helix domain-containing protein n=1 Tax=Roseibium polysiphoniae TaxID=2571221 RepID=A0ABR9C9A3_9HYPH|nr:AraC family transcriptional regulator [Roseibium polysiphoniae]MBD8876158.1 helix-turn-helix domain-containing protein [Roseibium polysiphoniae]